MSDETTDELIRAAYGVVSKPQRLIDLLQTLQDDRVANDANIEPLAQHFDRVTELIDEIDPNIGDNFADFDPTAMGEEPSGEDSEEALAPAQLCLSSDGRISHFDDQLFSSADIAVGRYLPEWMTDIDDAGFRDLSAAMRAGPIPEAMLIRLRLYEDDEAGQLFGIASTSDAAEDISLRAIRLRWQEQSGALFAKVLRLTDTEKQLARYIVDGLSIRQFAEARQRSIGTARNQLKGLLRKLSLSSQIELVTLYAGFHASMAAIVKEGQSVAGGGEGCVLDLPDGNILPYELHGDPNGCPVLYFHATADGAYLTPSQLAAAKDSNLRIIAPWLPYYAGSRVSGYGLTAIDEYLDRVETLLDDLGVEKCPIITVRVAAPYGFRAVQRNPDRFAALVTAGAVVPARDQSDFSHLAIGYRAPMRLARAAPAFVKLYFAATAAMVRKGQGGKFFRSLYGGSPSDLATLDEPEVVENLKRSLQRTFEDGYESTFQQTLLSASDWSHFCKGIGVPVRMISGQEDGLGPPEKVQSLCEQFGFEMIGPLENVGSLAMHQVPELVFDTVSRWATKG
ncbi:MAG: hypothetical protein AAGK17_11565 [Pseudomonadota bacterium]